MIDRASRLLYPLALLTLLIVTLLACNGGQNSEPPPPTTPPAPPPPAATEPAGEGEMCGGIAGIVCQEGLWCDPEPGFCQGADIAGTCIEVPEVCTDEYLPVCGCDGQTYGNDCERQAAQVAKDHDGECEGEDDGSADHM